MTTQEDIKQAQETLRNLRKEFKSDAEARKAERKAAHVLQESQIEQRGKMVSKILRLCYDWKKLGKSKKIEFCFHTRLAEIIEDE